MKDETDKFFSSRKDGLKTQKLLMKAAGKVFASRGYAEATSKEICELAKTNVAAINYYFGGKDNLYKAVLVEAHKQLISLEEIEDIYHQNISSEEKLRRLFYKILKTTHTPSKSWATRVFLRELVSQSRFSETGLIPAVLPKSSLAKKIMADLIGSPDENSPEVQRALSFAFLPLFSLILFPSKTRSKILPDLNPSSPDFWEDLINYTLTGLQSMKRDPQLPLFFPPYA